MILKSCFGSGSPISGTAVFSHGATLLVLIRLREMKTRHIIVTNSILIALLVSAPVFAEQQTYVVRKGDSLYRISKLFNTTPESLKELNGLNSDRLGIGQILKITADQPAESAKTVATPVNQSSTKTVADTNNQKQPQIQQTQHNNDTRQMRDETITYTVRSGDTLSRIAKTFNTSVNALTTANNIKISTKLRIGQVLTIPGSNNAAAKTQVASAEKAEPAPVSNQPAAKAVFREANQTAARPAVSGGEPTIRDRLVEAGFNMLGVRYRFGGTSEKTGFDCSGLVKNIFEKVGFMLPRSSREQYNQGEKVAKEDLQKGDLVFFSSSGKTPTHVGIYIGNDQFLHAASRAKKVVISDLGKNWYDFRYLGARRIIELWWEEARGPLNDAPSKEVIAPTPQSDALSETVTVAIVSQEDQ